MDTPSEPASRDIVHLADAMQISLEMAGIHAASASKLLAEIEDSVSTRVANRSKVVQLLSHLWALIGTAHRLSELIQQSPRLKKNSPPIQLFLRRTVNVETLRNYVERLRANLPTPPTPIRGVVSWVSERDPHLCLTVFAGTPHPETHTYTCSYDAWKGEFAQRFMLSVTDATVEIPAVMGAIEDVVASISDWALHEGCSTPSEVFAVFPVRMSGSRPPT